MKILIILFLCCQIYAQSSDATLTIYKDGTALIKQPITWNVGKGESKINWDNLPGSIQRDTPFLNLSSGTVMSQRFNDKVFSSADYLIGQKGQKVSLKPKDGKIITGILIAPK